MKTDTTSTNTAAKFKIAKPFVYILLASLGTLLLTEIFSSGEKVLGGEINRNLREELISDAIEDSSHYIYPPNSIISAPEFSIDMSVMCSFLKRFYPSGNVLGLRIYPAYASGNKLQYVIGVESITGEIYSEKSYVRINKNFTNGDDLYSALTDSITVLPYVQRYVDKIVIKNDDSIYNFKNTSSRFYSLDEIISYLSSNGIMYDSLDTQNDLNFVISGGFIDQQSRDFIYKYHKPSIPSDGCDYKKPADCIEGFTVLLSIVKDGSKWGLTYEIGNPCPPRCGSLRKL